MKAYLLTFFVCFSVLIASLFGQTDHSHSLVESQDRPDTEQQEQMPDDFPPEPSPDTNPLYSRDNISRDPFATDPFEASETRTSQETENFQTKFMNMLLTLGLLIGFMILASWMLKRMMRTRSEQLNQTSSIRVLETRTLSPRSTVYLLDIMGQGVVVAESHTGVTYLTTLPLEEERKEQETSRSPAPFPPSKRENQINH